MDRQEATRGPAADGAAEPGGREHGPAQARGPSLGPVHQALRRATVVKAHLQEATRCNHLQNSQAHLKDQT